MPVHRAWAVHSHAHALGHACGLGRVWSSEPAGSFFLVFFFVGLLGLGGHGSIPNIKCIIHCDLKLENILLDAQLHPKVANFGLPKLVGRDFSRVLTTMRGTIGNLAPKSISGLLITLKVDVYSFGMMLFELISGRRNKDHHEVSESGFFLVWAASRCKIGG